MFFEKENETTMQNFSSWSIPISLWQKGGVIENIMNTINRQEKKANDIHKKCSTSIEFTELVSETASSSSKSDIDTIIRHCNYENHQECDALLCTEEQQHLVEQNIDESTTPVPSWNTIKSNMINKLAKKVMQPHYEYRFNNCNGNQMSMTMNQSTGTNCLIDNKMYNHSGVDVDDDDYDSDCDAIHVLYYNQSTSRDATSTAMNHCNNVPEYEERIDPPNFESVFDVDTTDNSSLQVCKYIASMIDQYDFYSIMYTNNQIYDIRIYESLFTLLLFSNQNNSNIDNYNDATSTSDYDEAIQTVATVLVDPSIPFHSKLDIVQLLLIQQCRDQKQQPYSNGDEIIIIPDDIVRDMYAFCISLYFGVNDIEHTIHCHSRNGDSLNQVNHTFCNMMSDSTIMATSSSVTMTARTSSSSQQLLCPMMWELRSKCLYLQEIYTIYDDISVIRQQSRVAGSPGSVSMAPHCDDPCWEYIKNYCYDHDSILLKDIDLLKAFYNIIGKNKSLRFMMLIASIGYLRICMYHQEVVTTKNYYKYSEALHNVALFLSNWMISDNWKMAVLYCLQYNLDEMIGNNKSSTSTATNVLSSKTFQQKKASNDYMYYSKVLSFCTCDNAYTDSFLVTSPQNAATVANQSIKPADQAKNYNNDTTSLCAFYLLLWELRVLTCHHKQQRKELHQRFVSLLQHRMVQFRAFISKSASKLSNNSSIISTKHALTKQLPVAAVVIKSKVNQVRTTIHTQVQICRDSFTQK